MLSMRRALSTTTSISPEWVINKDALGKVGDLMSRHGVVLVRDLLSEAECDNVCSKLLDYADDVLRKVRPLPLGIGSAKGFDEVVVRSPGRYDVPVPFSRFEEKDLETLEVAALSGLGARGEDAKRAFCGVVCSDPGSTAQEWHVDSLHLSREHKPANLVNVLLALEDVTEDMGPTELVEGTHVLSNHLDENLEASKVGASLAYQTGRNSPESIGAASSRSASLAMSKGSALLFDDRILHRGLANKSSKKRILGYFSYRRSDFEPSTHFEAARNLEAFLESMDEGFDGADVAGEFPGVRDRVDDVFCDGASGSQIHESALDAMTEQLIRGNANVGGLYDTSTRVDAAVLAARRAYADFFNASSIAEIVFGANATTLNAHVGGALLRSFPKGSTVLVSAAEHDANAGMWTTLAARHEIRVRTIPLSRDGGIDPNDVVVDADTRLVCVGMASNALGTVNDVKKICDIARSAGALSYVDGVHAAPHVRVDVQEIGCDFAVVSPYKFFGPHLGVLYGRESILATLDVDKIQVSDNRLPCPENCYMSRMETGTQQFENVAGASAAVDYLASLGRRFGGILAKEATRSQEIEAGYAVIAYHENRIKRAFLDGIRDIPGVSVLGVSSKDDQDLTRRTSTFAVDVKGLTPDDLVAKLVYDHRIFCTAGNHYTTFWKEYYADREGVARISFLHYNTLGEVQRVLSALRVCADEAAASSS